MNMKLMSTALVGAMALTAPATAEELTLRAGVFVPPHTTYGAPFQMYADHLNEIGEGVLQIRIVGGPEAVPATELATAVSNGVLDMAALPPSYYKGQMVEADAQSLTPLSVAEQRETGAYAALDEIAQNKMGVTYVTTYGDGVPFHIFLTKEIEELGDLDGMRLRGQTTYNLIFDELGVNNTPIPAPDIFTALERKTVDGYGWALWGIGDMGWMDMTAVRVDPGFYNVIINVLMNKDTYDSLTEEQQGIVDETTAWFEEMMVEWSAEKTEAELAAQEAAGVASFDAGPELRETATAIYWKDLETLSPEIERLRPLLAPES
ncbi:TRAP dicarboxylate transporter, DctP subunit, putative [Pseudooceanicola batsensis HTCC2597]|uniref:TRAP dicarboxylate transporter, DctP subunit, putative n=1 Tax=Pseudooceanicola batsensis (strain ATCC BAA-863 / DSM 15984 / KCTC 12145 / HTCC2597) TaxID=252305 RepID=A3U0S4_PSEBH|nr:TRAP transporter substrate-binding protein DctP [Pseudooceanicola batsensis]EAQ02365.1 TRAP dicarboxylate transporter, DctP subunit, putative [Pseudooceanicola batsensis HTCC2597]